MKLKLLLISALVVLCGVMMPQIDTCAQELQEQTGHISDPEFQGIIEESMASIIETRASSRSVSWTVASNRRICSTYFDVSSNGYITLILTLSKSAKAGIISADGYVRYVTGTSINHTFSIGTSDTYCVFVQNLNSTAITAKGSYAWN